MLLLALRLCEGWEHAFDSVLPTGEREREHKHKHKHKQKRVRKTRGGRQY